MGDDVRNSANEFIFAGFCLAGRPFNDYGVTAYKMMRTLVQRYDSTRLTTVAMHPRYRNWATDSIPSDLALVTDVQSYNYRYRYFPVDGRRYPWMTFYQSEATTKEMGKNFFGMDLQHVRLTAVDSKGRKVWDCQDEVSISIDGDARIAAIGNGNIFGDEISTTGNTCHLYKGTALVILRSALKPSTVTLRVSSPKFKTVTCKLISLHQL